jgi:hypothetical protein
LCRQHLGCRIGELRAVDGEHYFHSMTPSHACVGDCIAEPHKKQSIKKFRFLPM